MRKSILSFPDKLRGQPNSKEVSVRSVGNRTWVVKNRRILQAPNSVDLATGSPNVVDPNGWKLKDIYRTLERTRTQEGQVAVDKLKEMTIVRMDGMSLKSTARDGTSTIVTYPHTNPDGTEGILAGGAVKATNTIYIYRDLTVLAAVETAYHEGIMHNGQGAGEYSARAGAALFMERIGLGTQFPQFLQTTSGVGSASQVTANPGGINASISQIYQTVTTINNVYGPKVLQTGP